MSTPFCTSMAASSTNDDRGGGGGGDRTNQLAMPVIISDDAVIQDNDDTGTHDMHHQMDHQMDGSMDMDHNHMNHTMDHSHMDHNHMNMATSAGMTMYMDGFHSALFYNSQHPPPCLNLFSPKWTLDTQNKFIAAMVFITLLGVLVEACGVWRVKLLTRGRVLRRRERARLRQQNDSLNNNSRNTNTTSPPPVFRFPPMFRRLYRNIIPQCIRDKINNWINTKDTPIQIKRLEIMAASLHAARASLGYLLMLAVMSYAIEFLVCTIIGMVLGRYWFIEVDNGENDLSTETVIDNNTTDGMWGGGDACCGIDDDEDFDTNNHGVNGSDEVESMRLQMEPLMEGAETINEPLLGNGSLSRRNVV